MSKSIIIIGAGIAGLSAGCYGQMNGYETQIFEMHDKPGGLCTSWKRKGYTFDGCIHWLVGSGAGSSFNRIWQELGAAQGRQMVDHDEFMRYRGPDGKDFVLYTNVDRLERHMKELAPADAKISAEFCAAIRRLTALGRLGQSSRIRALFQMIPFMLTMARYRKTSIQDFCRHLRDPFLRQALTALWDMPDFPLIGLLITLGWMHNKDAGYPIGGSLEFARAIEKRYLDLGGQIHYKSRVAKILVEEFPLPASGRGQGRGRAVGVRLTDGSEHRADIVISAADGHATIFDMLEGRYINDTIKGYYETLPIFPPIIQVSLGVARDLSHEPHAVTYALEQPITIAGAERKTLGVKHYCYDPTLAPKGRSVVEVIFPSNYAYWRALAEDRERYEAEKKDIALKVIAQLEQRYPGITGQIEVVDVATPLTTERYTGNWQGSVEGWLITTKTMGMMMPGKGMSKTLPGLENFYMVGQWVEPGGGLPPAAQSGRRIIERLCKQDGKPFTATLP